MMKPDESDVFFFFRHKLDRCTHIKDINCSTRLPALSEFKWPAGILKRVIECVKAAERKGARLEIEASLEKKIIDIYYNNNKIEIISIMQCCVF